MYAISSCLITIFIRNRQFHPVLRSVWNLIPLPVQGERRHGIRKGQEDIHQDGLHRYAEANQWARGYRGKLDARAAAIGRVFRVLR